MQWLMFKRKECEQEKELRPKRGKKPKSRDVKVSLEGLDRDELNDGHNTICTP